MATRNGAAYLDEQLRSLEWQTHASIDVWVSDDGSSDTTLAVLETLRRRWAKGAFSVVRGPERGFAENFRSLIVNPRIDADVFAFCDQDDVWERGKLETALAWMDTHPEGEPLLFCSSTLTIAASGRPIGRSPLFEQEPSFRNALVQSLAGGNTMVFNRTARQCIADASRRASFVSHDWWSYLVVTGVGGRVHYSAQPLVRYRQHDSNQIGANTTARARLAHLKRLAKGETARWFDRNLRGLEASRVLLTPDALKALDLFAKARSERLCARIANLRRSGVYRQTALGRLSLWAAIAFRLV